MVPVDTILTNGIVLTMDDSFSVYLDGAVAIQADSIVSVGDSSQINQDYQADDVIDCTGMAITPGLINAHTHVPMTLLRGLADDLRLDVWLMGYIMPTEREFVKPEFVKLGTSLACAEMIRSGVTSFADMYYFEDSVAEATAAAGMRAVCGQTVLKFPSPDAESFEEGLERCRHLITRWLSHPLIIPAVAPHAPYTNTPEMLQQCAALAVEFDVPLHIHISETALEVQNSRDENNMPVVPWVKKQGILKAKVIAAHCVHIDEGEMHTLHHHGAGVAHNPTSNLKLASGLAPVDKMLRLGLNVGIGTDGTASNNDLDLLEEIRLAALIAKVETDDPTALPAKAAFAMATSMGARAIHIGHLTGSLVPGKRADIAVIDLEQIHNQPRFQRDPDAIYSNIIYASKSTDVRHVMCNGSWLMRDGELLTVDTAGLLQEASLVAREIDAFLIAREGDVLSKLLAIGELQREESFEVQVKVRLQDSRVVDRLLTHPDVAIVRRSHYRQYDTYFEFDPPDFERVRYREDDFLDREGDVSNVRTRLTLTARGNDREFEHSILLSRSRYISPATRPLRFYREYFKARSEQTIVKERRRWHVDYKNLRLYINLDRLIDPEVEGFFLEIKSRTWSLTDAEQKAAAIAELLELLGVEQTALIKQEYITLET
jgi:5-methylthioadenosine/S-adenosylhomocysteine deaminase